MASCAAPPPSSYPMARSMTGSTKIRATANASTPARAPARRPRPMICFSIVWATRRASVAGEAEEVAGVVHEFVDVHVVAEYRRGALVDSDEVQHDEREER